MKLKVFVLFALLTVSLSAFADAIYSSGLGTTVIQPFGFTNTATYGEVFRDPNPDYILRNFSLWLNGSGHPLQFQAYIGHWTGTRVDVLAYSSPVQTLGPASGPQEFTFNVTSSQGALTGGASYVAFLSISQVYAADSSFGTTTMPMGTAGFGGHMVPGGGMVYYNNGGDFSALFNHSWNCTLTCNLGDVAFNADFTDGISTPEPSSLILLGSGLVGLGGAIRSKRAR